MVKRNHKAVNQQDKEPKRRRTQGLSRPTDWGCFLEGRGRNKVEVKNLLPIGVSQAIEYWPALAYRTLAIQYFPVESTTICSKPSTSHHLEWGLADLSEDPTGMRCEKDPQYIEYHSIRF